MMRGLIYIFFLLLISFCTKGQDFSNKGKEFWVGYGYHQAMMAADNVQEMVLYFTSDVSATVTVEIPGAGWAKTYQVSANTVTESDPIPKTGSQDARLYSDSLYNTGIHITSDNPIVAYAHIYSSTNSGASLLFPVNTLGQDYYSLNFTQKANTTASNSWAFVVATEDNTMVEITPSANTLKHLAGRTFSVTLNKGQIYNLMGTSSGNDGVDLTGTRIRSVSTGNSGCKRIAVYSGSGRVSINCENAVTSSDNLFQQVFPQSAWGKKFLTVPTSGLPNNYFRIAVSNPATVVTIDGVRAANLINNFYYEITANTSKSIIADMPVMVAQYITSGNDDATSPCGNSFNNKGDPEMIYLSPLEQTIDKITLNSTKYYRIDSHYINVVIKASAVNSFTLDGADSASAFKTHPGDPAYSFAVFRVQQGSHRLQADSGFNAIAYGYGIKESYGYNAGTNIKNLYQFITVQNPYAISNTACTNNPFLLSVTLPYQPTSLVWDFSNNPNLTPSQNITVNNPVADSSYAADGRTLYVFKLKGAFTFNAAGAYPVKIFANNQSSDGCNGQQEIDYDIQVLPPPVADFTINHTGCAGDTVRFLDASNGNGNAIVKWQWNFADQTTDTVMNPSKIYKDAGTYNVKLTSINDIGCFADVIKPFTLTQPPMAKFGFSSPNCVNNAISFTDSSTASEGNIVKWYWNFGDGNTSTNTTSAAVLKTYDKAGIYTVKLAVQLDNGCKSDTAQQIVTIVPSPVTNFLLPEICVNDPAATFTDSSYIPGGGGVLTYSWNFGDENATASNPNTSTDQNPKHQFSAPGLYNISLTAASNTGCSSSVTKPFIVNGVPQTDFTVIDSASLCNNMQVQIQNNSSVSPGSIIKIEILWDNNAPATMVTDNEPSVGEIYSHTYPSASTAQTYQVKMRAYSGINCFDEKVIPITVKPSPKVTFSAIPGICLNDSAFTITQAKETTGIPGTFAFSGKGVTPTGEFSPSSAGAGEANIKYTFTSTHGCADSMEQTIQVIPNPTVQLTPEVYALEGGSVILQPVITGNVSVYAWSPGTWLNNANIKTPRSTPAGNISYTLTVSSPEGCTAFDNINVSVLTAPIIPNAFSPNGDGINDVWNIASLQSFSNCTVQVFNRYGKPVFNSIGYSKPWDGRYNESPLPAGVYYYVINLGNGKKPYSGYLTILK